MTPAWIWLSAGFVAGALAASVIFLRRNAELGAQNRVLGEKLRFADENASRDRATRESLEKEFRIAASDTLKNTTEQFLSAAIRDLRQVKTETDLSVDKKKSEIESFVLDMKARLEESHKLIRGFEEERGQMYGKVERSLAQVLDAENLIRMETSALKKALTSSSGVRGQWGERVLEEILEQSNLVRGIHFDTQVTTQSQNPDIADARPDFVIRLPGNKKLVIDSKEVAGEYLLAQQTEDPIRQQEHYQKLVANIRSNFMKLGRKEYQSQLDAEVPFVVMFIPSEAAIRAAFATDPGIFQEATTRRVILASPMTIAPLVFLIAHGWEKQKLADNARELGIVVEELGNRLFKFVEHLHGIRAGLHKAAEGWNRAMGSWQSRVAPQIDKARFLGGKFKEVEALERLDQETIPAEDTNHN